jgi:hypothetical protein
MFLHRTVPNLAVVLALASPSAQAFFDPPWITPAAPRAGEMVSISIHGGVCDAIFFRPGYPQITQDGNSVRIVEYGDHVTLGDEWCIYGIGTLTEPIGAFPPGDYTLTVDLVYDNYPFGLGTMTIGVIPFTVTGVTPSAPVPVSTPAWMSALLVLMSGTALWTLRMRRRSRPFSDSTRASHIT